MKKDGLKIVLSGDTGFCSGVRRAIKLAVGVSNKKKGGVYTLGPIIHNPQEVKRLEERGIRVVKDIAGIRKGTIVIRSHGLAKPVVERIRKKGLSMADATCPFVKRAQRIAQELQDEGYHLVIAGERKHPEVRAIISFLKPEITVVQNVAEADRIPAMKKIGIISQTTQSFTVFRDIVGILLAKSKEIKICDTICDQTRRRQEKCASLAEKADCMIIIGGKNSANTSRLYEMCKKHVKSYHIETAGEIRKNWFRGKRLVGIATGTSTPDWVIREVIEKIRSHKNSWKAGE